MSVIVDRMGSKTGILLIKKDKKKSDFDRFMQTTKIADEIKPTIWLITPGPVIKQATLLPPPLEEPPVLSETSPHYKNKVAGNRDACNSITAIVQELIIINNNSHVANTFFAIAKTTQCQKSSDPWSIDTNLDLDVDKNPQGSTLCPTFVWVGMFLTEDQPRERQLAQTTQPSVHIFYKAH